ncbi:hypothetical protein SDC9_79528 [bioreactor metagenome]|uniref:PEGA domain-containing protein n=1 Tax=bioreactor metagenome TaxID=1076179 RepID=A0A644YYP6_9ZZZZ
MPSGQFTVAISKAGFVGTTTLMAIANGQVTVGTAHLQEQLGRILIGVSDGSNHYLSQATATFMVGDALATATSDDYGIITFENVTAGTYSVTVSKDGYKSVTMPVAVTAGNQALASVRLLPIVLNTATITLVDSNTHNPISNATISVADNGYGKNIETDSSGQAVFTGMPDGTYTFYVTAGNYYGARPSYTITGGTSLTQTISLNPLMGSATFTVLDGADSPVDSAIVSINVNGVTKTATTSSSGIAAMSLPVGTYSYTVSKSGYISSNGNVTIRYSTNSPIEVSLIRQPVGTVSVQLVNMASMPIVGATVQISGNGITQTQVTESHGRVYFANIPYGLYTVSTLYMGFPSSASVMITNSQPYPFVGLRSSII